MFTVTLQNITTINNKNGVYTKVICCIYYPPVIRFSSTMYTIIAYNESLSWASLFIPGWRLLLSFQEGLIMNHIFLKFTHICKWNPWPKQWPNFEQCSFPPIFIDGILFFLHWIPLQRTFLLKCYLFFSYHIPETFFPYSEITAPTSVETPRYLSYLSVYPLLYSQCQEKGLAQSWPQ